MLKFLILKQRDFGKPDAYGLTEGKEVRLVRTLVAGLIIAIVCLVTYAVTSIQNSW